MYLSELFRYFLQQFCNFLVWRFVEIHIVTVLGFFTNRCRICNILRWFSKRLTNDRKQREKQQTAMERSFLMKRHHRDFRSEVKNKLQRKRLKDMSRKLTEYWHIYPRQYVILLCFAVSIVTRQKNLFLDTTINRDLLFAHGLFFDKWFEVLLTYSIRVLEGLLLSNQRLGRNLGFQSRAPFTKRANGLIFVLVFP